MKTTNSKRSYYKYLLVFSLSFFLFSCNEDCPYDHSPIIPQQEEVTFFGKSIQQQHLRNEYIVMPLAVGNKGIYDCYACFNNIDMDLFMESITIVDSVNRNGTIGYKAEHHTGRNGPEEHHYGTCYYTNTTTGLFCKNSLDTDSVMVAPNYRLTEDGGIYPPGGADKMYQHLGTKMLFPIFEDKMKKGSFQTITRDSLIRVDYYNWLIFPKINDLQAVSRYEFHVIDECDDYGFAKIYQPGVGLMLSQYFITGAMVGGMPATTRIGKGLIDVSLKE